MNPIRGRKEGDPLATRRMGRWLAMVSILLAKPLPRAQLKRELEKVGFPIGDSALADDLQHLEQAGWLERPGSGGRSPYRLRMDAIPLFMTMAEARGVKQVIEMAGPTSEVLQQPLRALLERVPSRVRSRLRVAEVWHPHAPRHVRATDPRVLETLTTLLAARYCFRFEYRSPTRGERSVWYKVVAARLTNVDGALCVLAYVPEPPTSDPEGLKPAPRRGGDTRREFRVDRIRSVRPIEGQPDMDMTSLAPCRWVYLVDEAFLKLWQPPEGHVELGPQDLPGFAWPPGARAFLGESLSPFRAIRWLVEKGEGVWVPDLPGGSHPAAEETVRIRLGLGSHLRLLARRYGLLV